MKKLLAAILSLSLAAFSLAGCGASGSSSSTDSSASESSQEASEQVYKIGVVQLVEHDALDSAYQGFVDGLKEAGYEDGKNIAIDYQNAQGEQANCNTIASKFVNDQDDLILAIATPAAQAAANATTDIPILVTAVTDPANAKLVASNEAPGGNVTGTSDLNPIKEQMDLIKQLVPDVKKVGMLYCSSEANSEFQVNLAKEQLETMGIESEDFTVSSTNEIQQVVESMVGKVDAVYVPTDNMIASGIVTVSAVAVDAKLPVIVAEPWVVKNGGLGTYGLSYYNLGKQTAAMAVKVLTGEAKPADMPIEYLDEADLMLNQDIIDALGITVPQELLDKAEIVTTEKAN